ncbi:hypothetical protein B0H11DRAFT_2303374 [Mycena galericulata]|nr:hypothetical protein B0H11DRAFT_2303374 [Mycena galericulata]
MSTTVSLQQYFYQGITKQNVSHYHTYCKACVKHHLDGMGATMSDTQTFQDACAAVGSTRGEKTAWISHLIGGKHKEACPHASPEAKADAATLVNLRRA